MEKFLSLPEEKQNMIIDAALLCFGINGYKKTSVNDIAVAAGISKALIFHYFGTKKTLYLYLIDLCGNTIMKNINEKFDGNISDFFDRIKLTARIKMSALAKHPAMTPFLASVYNEKNEEVKAEIDNFLTNQTWDEAKNRMIFEGMDVSKFKNGIDPKHVFIMLQWMSEGYASELPSNKKYDFEVFFKEFEACIELLKNNFYKK